MNYGCQMIAIFTLAFFCYAMTCFGDLSSAKGTINFDSNFDLIPEMVLNSQGLGIGTSPSTNLHVSGNSLVSGTSHIKNLELSGGMAVTHTTISASGLVDLEKSFYQVNTLGAGNLTIELPLASEHLGKVVHFKKLYSGGNVVLNSTNGIESQGDYVLENGEFVQLISSGNYWYVYNASHAIASSIAYDNRPLYFNFDDSIEDYSSSSSNTTFNGGTAAYTAGIRGNALVFDGTNDYLEVPDDAKLDIDQNFSISFWVKPSANTVNLTNFTGATAASPLAYRVNNAPEAGEVGFTLTGNIYQLISAQHKDGIVRNSYAQSNLNVSDLSDMAWATSHLSGGSSLSGNVENGEASSMAIASTGNALYFSTLLCDDASENFFTAHSNNDFSNFSGWTQRTAPDGASTNDRGFLDMITVDETMYFASYLHNNTVEDFQVASTSIHGNDAITWSSPSGQPDGSDDQQYSSVAMDSDGAKLYYALFTTSSADIESLYCASSNLDGSGYTITGPLTAPDGMTANFPSHISTVIVGSKIHYGLIYSNAAGVKLHTAYSDLDFGNMSTWVDRGFIYTDDASKTKDNLTGDSLSLDMLSSGEDIRYLISMRAFKTNLYDRLFVYTLDLSGGPIINKEGAYALHYSQGGLALEWAGARHHFGNLSTADYNLVNITHDGEKVIFYVDGSEVYRQTSDTVFNTSSSNLTLGGDGTRFFDGSVDDFRVYDKVLTPAFIQALFQEKN